MDAAFDAYERGDYLSAGRLARQATSSTDASVRRSATDLLRRLRADRVQWSVMLACTALLIAIVMVYAP